MKNVAVGIWHGLGFTGRLLLGCFLFYFICKTVGKN